MSKLSPLREAEPLLEGWTPSHRGKVRDTYEMGRDALLVRATNAVSIFDFVLNATIPMKGIILTAMNHFWSGILANYGISTHLIAAGGRIKDLPPSILERPELAASLSCVVRLAMRPVEFIARGILTGSGLTSYRENRSVCGHPLPSGLQDGDLLSCVLDTPTTKAEEGHDEPLSAEAVRREFPEETYQTLRIFQILAGFAATRGIRMVDTKFEFGVGPRGIIIGDEIGTPDSSRFCDERAWQESRKPATSRTLPAALDKQFVRAWGTEQGIKKLDPKNPAHVATVHSWEVPQAIIRTTTNVYRYIFWRLTGMRIEEYCRRELEVRLPEQVSKVAIVVGSDSDLPAIRAGLASVGLSPGSSVNVISCHRNPDALVQFVKGDCWGADAVLAAGGKAFALPGVIDALIHAAGKHIPVVGVALGDLGSTDLLAAQLSISQLPGTPVVMDELTGTVYTGVEGVRKAVDRIYNGELPPPKSRTEKSARLNVSLSETN